MLSCHYEMKENINRYEHFYKARMCNTGKHKCFVIVANNKEEKKWEETVCFFPIFKEKCCD